MSENIVFCGVGGQGTVLASKLVAAAAMKEKRHVMTAETIGMAQRGGSVFSHMKIGEAASPLIGRGEADLIIGFEPGETVRQLPFLKQGGAVVTSIRPVQPVSAMIGLAEYDADAMIEYLKKKVRHLVLIDADESLRELSNPKVLNMVLLGAAVSTGKLSVAVEDIEQALHEKLSEKLWPVNERALRYAMNRR